jgi:hypothetical protein
MANRPPQGKKEPAFRELHKVADAAEPRLDRAFLRAAERMKKKIMIHELGIAFSSGSVRRVMKLLKDRMDIKENLEPMGQISSDLFARGFNLGRRIANEEIEARLLNEEIEGTIQ